MEVIFSLYQHVPKGNVENLLRSSGVDSQLGIRRHADLVQPGISKVGAIRPNWNIVLGSRSPSSDLGVHAKAGAANSKNRTNEGSFHGSKFSLLGQNRAKRRDEVHPDLMG